jgi:hypothetical protein
MSMEFGWGGNNHFVMILAGGGSILRAKVESIYPAEGWDLACLGELFEFRNTPTAFFDGGREKGCCHSFENEMGWRKE